MAGFGRKSDNIVMLKLAGGSTVAEAAQQARISECRVFRRLADSDFRWRVSELRAEMVQRALGNMADGMAEAARTLRALLSADKESVRLGAARSILELGNKLRESVELEPRLAAIEQHVSARSNRSKR